MKYQTKLMDNQWQRMRRLIIPTGLAILFLVALLFGLGGVTPVQADPGVLYIDGATGEDMPTCGAADTPCQTILYSLDNQADSGDTIRIAAGTYTENITIEAMTLTLRGGYTIDDGLWFTDTGETVFNGDNFERVFAIKDSNLALENLTITRGYADDTNGGGGISAENSSISMTNSILISNTVTFADGGGLAAYDDSVVVLSDVEIRNNQVDETSPWGFGGGLFFEGGTQATINHLQLIGNTAIEGGGGLYLDDADTAIVIHHSQIISNTTTGDEYGYGDGGGGLGVRRGSMTVTNSIIEGNSAPNNFGGGLSTLEGGRLTVLDSRITNNSTKDHGGALSAGQATISMTNVLLTGNKTQAGDANVLSIDDSNVTIMNSTITGNNPGGAQAVILWSGGLTITNSILSNNSLNLQADPPCPSCFNVNYSNMEGGWYSGYGNINTDPLFVGGGDYHLQSGSLCIDAGTNTGAPNHDLAQNPRPQDGDENGIATTDMGAYEYRLNWIFLPSLFKDFGP